MRIFILFICFFVLKSYAQSESLERPVALEVRKTIGKCVQWGPIRYNDTQPTRICTHDIPCDLRPPLISEPITVSCRCYIDYSDKHPEYFSSLARTSRREIFWKEEGTDIDPQKAEEKARSICNKSFKSRWKNSEHWITHVNHCFIMYSYTCEDGSIKKSTGRF